MVETTFVVSPNDYVHYHGNTLYYGYINYQGNSNYHGHMHYHENLHYYGCELSRKYAKPRTYALPLKYELSHKYVWRKKADHLDLKPTSILLTQLNAQLCNIFSPKCSKFMQQRKSTLLNKRNGQITVWCNAMDREWNVANSVLNNLCIDSYFDYTSQMRWKGGLNG